MLADEPTGALDTETRRGGPAPCCAAASTRLRRRARHPRVAARGLGRPRRVPARRRDRRLHVVRRRARGRRLVTAPLERPAPPAPHAVAPSSRLARWWGGWRVALRLARRDSWRGKGRALLVAAAHRPSGRDGRPPSIVYAARRGAALRDQPAHALARRRGRRAVCLRHRARSCQAPSLAPRATATGETPSPAADDPRARSRPDRALVEHRRSPRRRPRVRDRGGVPSILRRPGRRATPSIAGRLVDVREAGSRQSVGGRRSTSGRPASTAAQESGPPSSRPPTRRRARRARFTVVGADPPARRQLAAASSSPWSAPA